MATASSVYTLNTGAKGVEEDRLDQQHKAVFRPTTKTLLPDFVSQHLSSLSRPAAVADVATGTGVWLKSLAAELPPDARLDGYDFDTSKYPPPESLPSNVQLKYGDGLEPFPEEVLGQYDLVHVRLLMYGLKAPQWEDMAANLRTLLRPGGYLLWEDVGYPSWNCMPMTDNFKKWISVEVRYATAVGRDPTAPVHLLEQFKNQGFVNCTQTTFSTYSQSKEIQKLAGVGVMAVAAQSMRGMVAKGGFDWVQTNADADEAAEAVSNDIKSDVCVVGFEVYWIIGQAPLG